MEALDLEPALVLDDRIEDALHDVRVDQMAFGLDDFAQGFHLGNNRSPVGVTCGAGRARRPRLELKQAAAYFLNRLSNAARASAGERGLLMGAPLAEPLESGVLPSRATVTREENDTHWLA